MTATFRGGGPVIASTTSATVSVTLTGAWQPQAGDTLIIFHGNDFYDGTPMATPTVGGSTTGVNPELTVSAGNPNAQLKVYSYKVASTGDLTVSETETGPNNDEEKVLVVWVCAGADSTDPVADAVGSFSSTGQSTFVFTGGTAANAGDLMLLHHNSGGGSSASTPMTPPGAPYVEAYDTSTGGIAYTGGSEALTAAGATGTRTMSSIGSVSWVGALVIVRSATPTGPNDGYRQPDTWPGTGPWGPVTPGWVQPLSTDPVTPPAVSGLVGWWKADSLSQSNGSGVSSWPDSSGHGQTLVQATGSLQPLFTTNVINGLPALRFDGTDDKLVATASSYTQPTHWFIVTKAADATQYLQWVHSGQEIMRRDTDLRVESYSGISASNATMTHDGSAWDYFSIEFNGASTMGYRIGNVNYPPWGDAGSNATGTTLTVGNHASVSARAFHGDIAEIIVYNRALTSSERESVFTYLKNKYFSSGTSTVTSDLDLRWAVRNVVTSDADLRWKVSNTVTQDLDLRWKVSNTVTSDVDLRWKSYAQVTSDADLRWRVSNVVTSDVDLRWKVSNVVTSDCDLRWKVANTVTSDVDLRWKSYAQVTSDCDLRWKSYAQITSDADLRWQVKNTVTQDVDLRWRVANQVTSDCDLRWIVRNQVTSDVDLRWRVSTVVTQDADLRWRVSNTVTSDCDLRWITYNQASNGLDVQWRVANTVTSDCDLRWAVLSTVTQDVDLRWRVLGLVTQDLDLRWVVNSTSLTVTQDLDLRWRVSEKVSGDLDLRWREVEVVSNGLDVQWAVRATVTQDADLRWRTAEVVQGTCDLRWAVLGRLSADCDLRWAVRALVTADLDLQWVSTMADLPTLPLPADVRVSLADDRVTADLQNRVRASLAADRTVAYLRGVR